MKNVDPNFKKHHLSSNNYLNNSVPCFTHLHSFHCNILQPSSGNRLFIWSFSSAAQSENGIKQNISFDMELFSDLFTDFHFISIFFLLAEAALKGGMII